MILSLVILNDQFLVRPILTCLQKAAGCSFNFRHWMLFYKGNRNDSYSNAAAAAI